ncbi:MAG TPA: hypothetical protein VM681_02445 [Candidatus Thermoplasmatota archaeon]|nr:hypothetical protein [Candidatus Thermoplasmatota archaeon]
MAKRRRQKSALRSASKVQEKNVLEAAEQLARDPSAIVPSCVGHRDHFARERRAVAKIHALREKPSSLGWRASWFTPPIARGYAATLLALSEGKLPYVAALPTPFGPAPYVLRGRAKRAILVGLQNWNDPRLRLFLALDHAKAHRATVYATEEGLVCCGRDEAPPPPGFVEATAKRLGLAPSGEGTFGSAAADEARLVIDWKPASVRLVVAESAATGNTVLLIGERLASPAIRNQFAVSVEMPALEQRGSAPVPLPQTPPPAKEDLAAYYHGKLSDRDLVARARDALAAALRSVGQTVYVAGGATYGADREAFLAALLPSELERRAIDAGLAGFEGPIVLDRATPAQLLAKLWPSQAKAMVEAVAGDAELARRVLAESDAERTGVGAILARAAELSRRAGIDAKLPRFAGLPAPVALADAVARALRADGRAGADRVLRQAPDDDTKTRAARLALEREALGAGQDWRHLPTESEIATFVAPQVRRVLACPPSEYEEALSELSTALGYTEKLQRLP